MEQIETPMVGGCEGNYFQKSVVGILVVVAVLFIFYVFMFMRDSKLLSESMCGGADQSCVCSGNETMTSGRVTDNYLTRAGVGY
jgi:uncharacterized membrane protein